jgi:hypothetical protein
VTDIYSKSELYGILQGFNPWWSGQAYTVPEFRRLAWQACRRYLDDQALQRAVLLSGPRRVGKTVILQQIADSYLKESRDPKSIFYLSLDHPLLKLATLPQILRLYHEQVHPVGQPTILLLDEVQYAGDWELHLKSLIDHKAEYRILATGSASVIHRQRLAESGVGRWIRVPIPTLSFYEFLRIRGEQHPPISEQLRPNDLFTASLGELSELGLHFRPLMPLFMRYLLVGGFPETARQSDVGLCQRLLREDVVERVLKRDMTALFGIRNVNDLEKLFIYICLNSGGILSVQTCASALGVSATTVGNHLNALEQSHLIYRLPPTGAGGKKLLKARDKVYLVDAALRNAVLLRGEETLKDAQEMGAIAETTVLRHLYAYYYHDTPEIAYWRDAATGKEVDIIVRSPAYTMPVEVKFRADADLAQTDGLAAYCSQENIGRAYFVTQSEDDFGVLKFPGLETSFLKIPAHIFCYLLGQAERLL